MHKNEAMGIILSITVLFLISLMPIVHGIGIYQELPTKVKVGEEYKDVLIQIQENDPDGFDGVKRVALILNSPQGNTLKVLAEENKYGYEWNLDDGVENFYLTFKIPESLPIEKGKEYSFEVETTLYEHYDILEDECFNKSATYSVYIESIEKEKNPYIPIGIITGSISLVIVALLIIRYGRREKKE